MNGMKFPKHEASMSLNHNEHKACYDPIAAYISELPFHEWATPTSKARCIETDEIWELQWYPNTPVGFCTMYGATLEEVLEAATPTQLLEGEIITKTSI